jgi:hypothetical protein
MDRKNYVKYNEKIEVEKSVADISDAARKMEGKLRFKTDLFVVPSVTLLYPMCFVDRTNIGLSPS